MPTFAGQWGPEPFTDGGGNRKPLALVYVFEADGSTLAALWADRAKSAPLANPLPRVVPSGAAGLDGQANGIFYADPGSYVLKVREEVGGPLVFEGPVLVPVDPADVETLEVSQEELDDEVDARAAGDTAQAAALAAHASASTGVHGIVNTADLVLTSDARLTDARPPTGPAGGVLAGAYPDPGFAVPMETVASAEARVAAAIAALLDSAPGTLDTLNELAAALADDPNFATTITNALAGKQPLDDDLTAIASMVTTAFGRGLLGLADGPALRALLPIDVQVFTTPGAGTWVKPPWATADSRVWVACIGGSGGAGSGRRGGVATVRCGGGGTAHGGRSETIFRAGDLGPTEPVNVGAAGIGGAAVTTDNTNGNNGTSGGTTTFGSTATTMLRAGGSGGGGGGTTTTGTGGAGPGASLNVVGSGAAAATTGVAGTAGGSASGGTGGAGGGLTALDATSAGGAGGIGAFRQTGGGSAGAAGGGAGGDGAGVATGVPHLGTGGGGGGSSSSSAGGDGGKGGLYGGGAGGGGASANGFNSGKGADGQPGIVVAITW